MKKKIFVRVFAVLLVLVLCCVSMPASALEAWTTHEWPEKDGTTTFTAKTGYTTGTDLACVTANAIFGGSYTTTDNWEGEVLPEELWITANAHATNSEGVSLDDTFIYIQFNDGSTDYTRVGQGITSASTSFSQDSYETQYGSMATIYTGVECVYNGTTYERTQGVIHNRLYMYFVRGEEGWVETLTS